eukprot:TRINITY_DN1055_c0_g1_i2.p1 TRINITY_DN1055_c0_g1~~TRINITY_DN1055_c0_g1_i2.p1  ORF type:complete len:245 (-),score=59.04 TRINITY_DN1055_c0_g1_i2:248-919(-)
MNEKQGASPDEPHPSLPTTPAEPRAVGPNPPPLLLRSYDGFAYGAESNAVIVELYGDFVCPDTAVAWNTIWKPLLKQFPNSVQFRYHMLALPYHRASYDACQAALAYVGLLGDTGRPENFFVYADTIFREQGQFFNGKTEELTHRDVVQLFATMVTRIGSGVTAEAFAKAFADGKYDTAARLSWKWGVSKGVYGTPTYAINGAIIPEAADWDLKQWTSVLSGR